MVILLALRFRGAEIPFLTFYCIVCLVRSSVGMLTRRFLCENVDRYVTLCCRPPILCPSSNVRLKLLQTLYTALEPELSRHVCELRKSHWNEPPLGATVILELFEFQVLL
jgi:hypothetical protein